MEITIFLVIMASIFIFRFVLNADKVSNHKKLQQKVPIFSTENIGRDFVAIKPVSSSHSDKIKAEIDLMEQAEEVGADAIIGCNINVQTHTSGGVSTSRGPLGMGKMEIKDNRSTSSEFHYYGTAIKYVEKNSNEEQVKEEAIPTPNKIENTIEEQSQVVDSDITQELVDGFQEKAKVEISKLSQNLQENLDKVDNIEKKYNAEFVEEVNNLKILLEEKMINEEEFESKKNNLKEKVKANLNNLKKEKEQLELSFKNQQEKIEFKVQEKKEQLALKIKEEKEKDEREERLGIKGKQAFIDLKLQEGYVYQPHKDGYRIPSSNMLFKVVSVNGEWKMEEQ